MKNLWKILKIGVKLRLLNIFHDDSPAWVEKKIQLLYTARSMKEMKENESDNGKEVG
jgi:hypothetical protein